LNGKGGVRITEVLTAVYGSSNASKLEALLKVQERINAKLAIDGRPVQVCRRGEILILSPL
jgi:hypothetical protein